MKKISLLNISLLSLLAITLLMTGCNRDHDHADSSDRNDYRMEVRRDGDHDRNNQKNHDLWKKDNDRD
jgi:hypothetical protein